MSAGYTNTNSGGILYLDGSGNVMADYGTSITISGSGMTVAGSQYGFAQQTQQPSQQGQTKRIGPKLYFSYVKSKLNKTQLKKLKSRLTKLQTLVKSAEETGQKALYEEFSKMLVVAVRESEAAACGHDVYVNKKDINKFMNLVTEDQQSRRNPIRFKKLEEFPRAIPTKIRKIIKSVQSKQLFDELHILYLDYTGEEIKSNKEKIREKDPVLFGKFAYDDEKYYFIADWIDDYCDLTLSSFVDKLKSEDEEYSVSKTEDVTPEYLERIKKEIQERDERLKNTRPGNFRDLMKEEDKAELNRLKAENDKLKQDEIHRLEDREIAIAIKRALRDGAEWRKEASQETGQENLIDPAPKKPWYRRLF